MSLEKQVNERIFGLDLVRALAILLVVFSHIYYLIGSKNPLLISISGLFGFAGVELFFVLSGFLIGSILLRMFLADEFTIKHLLVFLKRRWFRTLPAYYFVLIINVLVASVLSYQSSDWWRYFGFVQNFSNYKIVAFSESWSLSVEEWAYVITPLALFFAYKIFKMNKKFGFLFASLVLVFIFHLLRYNLFMATKISDMQTWNLAVKSLVVYRIDSILIGFLVAWCHYYYKEILNTYSVYLFIISGHLFFLQFVALNAIGVDIISHPHYFIVYYFTFSSMTLALALPVFIYWEQSLGFVKSIVSFVSKVSYSVYLLHYSIVAVIMKRMVDVSRLSSLQLFVFVLSYVGVVFFLGFLTYMYIEKPMMKLRDKV